MAGPSQRRLSKASRGRRTLTDTDDDALRFGFVTDPEQANDRLCHRLAGLLLGRFRRRFLVKRRYLRNPPRPIRMACHRTSAMLQRARKTSQAVGLTYCGGTDSSRVVPLSLVSSSPEVRPPAVPPRSVDDARERANAAMDRYAQGDDLAFAEVYDAVAPRVHAYLLRQTKNRISADDLLQQTLLQMHRNRGSFECGLDVLPWAFAIARRLFIDEFRRRKTDALWSARAVSDEDRLVSNPPDDEAATRELLGLLEAELSTLPETQRVVFELVRVDGLSHDEAAQVLGTSVGAVKLRAFRAHAALRAVLNRRAQGLNDSEPQSTA
jgi:RNA polymerase sigma-70 factor (ECF subfamily)